MGQTLVALFLLTFCAVTCAEKPHFVITAWKQGEQENQWYAYYGEPNSDNAVRITVRTVGGHIFFETSDACPEKGKSGSMSWENGQDAAIYVDCNGKEIRIANLRTFQQKWEPFPQPVEEALRNSPSPDRDGRPALYAGQTEGH
jgi:hypothetical protein